MTTRFAPRARVLRGCSVTTKSYSPNQLEATSHGLAESGGDSVRQLQ